MLIIDPKEQFPHFPGAPIVEAALEVRGDVIASWTRDELESEFQVKLPDYPFRMPLQSFQQMVSIQHGNASLSSPDLAFLGMRAESSDRLNIVQFRRDAFVFSRLKPYQNFNIFYREAVRVLPIYLDSTKPSAITRLGLRFINRITLEKLAPEKILRDVPRAPTTLPGVLTRAFLHQNTFTIPNYPYVINLTTTVGGADLIIDIDVFVKQPTQLGEIEEKFAEMRWIKNKVFFGVISDDAIRGFQNA